METMSRCGTEGQWEVGEFWTDSGVDGTCRPTKLGKGWSLREGLKMLLPSLELLYLAGRSCHRLGLEDSGREDRRGGRTQGIGWRRVRGRYPCTLAWGAKRPVSRARTPYNAESCRQRASAPHHTRCSEGRWEDRLGRFSRPLGCNSSPGSETGPSQMSGPGDPEVPKTNTTRPIVYLPRALQPPLPTVLLPPKVSAKIPPPQGDLP